MHSKRCPNCGENATWVLALDGAKDVAVCEKCGAWVCAPRTQADPQVIYAEPYFNGSEYTSYQAAAGVYRRNFQRKIALLRATGILASPHARILEIGSASGVFLDALRDNGFSQAVGVEVSEYARHQACAKGHEVLSPFDERLEKTIRDLHPTTICAWDVWEHLPDPAAVFDTYFSWSDAHVGVAITTVDSGHFVPRWRKTKWRQFHPPSHLNYPTRRSFELYFSSRGMRVLRHQSFGMHRPLADYLMTLAKPFGGTIAPGSRLYKIPVYANLFDIQLVIAQRLDAISDASQR